MLLLNILRWKRIFQIYSNQCETQRQFPCQSSCSCYLLSNIPPFYPLDPSKAGCSSWWGLLRVCCLRPFLPSLLPSTVLAGEVSRNPKHKLQTAPWRVKIWNGGRVCVCKIPLKHFLSSGIGTLAHKKLSESTFLLGVSVLLLCELRLLNEAFLLGFRTPMGQVCIFFKIPYNH